VREDVLYQGEASGDSISNASTIVLDPLPLFVDIVEPAPLPFALPALLPRVNSEGCSLTSLVSISPSSNAHRDDDEDDDVPHPPRLATPEISATNAPQLNKWMHSSVM